MEANPYETPKAASDDMAERAGDDEPLFIAATSLAAGLAGMFAAGIFVVALIFTLAGL